MTLEIADVETPNSRATSTNYIPKTCQECRPDITLSLTTLSVLVHDTVACAKVPSLF